MFGKKKDEEIILEVAKKESASSTIVLVVASLLCIFTGLVLLYVPQITSLAITYIYLAGIIIWGVYVLVRYFQLENYKKYHDYSFSAGAVALVLGCCGLVRANGISQNLDGYIGVAVLMLGIIMLQNAIRMKFTNNILWGVELGLSLLSVICAVIILTGFKAVLDMADGLEYYMLVAGGAFSIISIPIVAYGIHRNKKREERRFEVADMASQIQLDDVTEPLITEENGVYEEKAEESGGLIAEGLSDEDDMNSAGDA